MPELVRKTYSKGKKTRELVLDAALNVFAEKGFRESKVEDIALRSSLAKGTLYQYFKSKDEIYDACLTRIQSSTQLYLQELHNRFKSPDTFGRNEFLKTLRESYKQFFTLNQATGLPYLQLFLSALHSEESLPRTKAQRIFQDCVRFYDSFLQNAKNKGVVKSQVRSKYLAIFIVSLAVESAHEALVRTGSLSAQEDFVESFMRFVSDALILST